MSCLKKLISITLCIITLLLFVIPVFAVNDQVNNSYEELLNKGYPEDFLGSVSDTIIDDIASRVGDNEVIYINYRTDKWPGIISKGSDKSKVILKIVSVGLQDKETGKAKGEVVSVYWEWGNKKPVIREEDSIRIVWTDDGLCYKPDSFYTEAYSRKRSGDKWAVTNKSYALSKINFSSIIMWTDLDESMNQVGGALNFELMTEESDRILSKNDNSVIAEYSHEMEKAKIIISIIVIAAIIAAIIFPIIFVIRKKTK